MKIKELVLLAILGVSLAACGGGSDDNSNNDDGGNGDHDIGGHTGDKDPVDPDKDKTEPIPFKFPSSLKPMPVKEYSQAEELKLTEDLLKSKDEANKEVVKDIAELIKKDGDFEKGIASGLGESVSDPDDNTKTVKINRKLDKSMSLKDGLATVDEGPYVETLDVMAEKEGASPSKIGEAKGKLYIVNSLGLSSGVKDNRALLVMEKITKLPTDGALKPLKSFINRGVSTLGVVGKSTSLEELSKVAQAFRHGDSIRYKGQAFAMDRDILNFSANGAQVNQFLNVEYTVDLASQKGEGVIRPNETHKDQAQILTLAPTDPLDITQNIKGLADKAAAKSKDPKNVAFDEIVLESADLGEHTAGKGEDGNKFFTPDGKFFGVLNAPATAKYGSVDFNTPAGALTYSLMFTGGGVSSLAGYLTVTKDGALLTNSKSGFSPIGFVAQHDFTDSKLVDKNTGTVISVKPEELSKISKDKNRQFYKGIDDKGMPKDPVDSAIYDESGFTIDNPGVIVFTRALVDNEGVVNDKVWNIGVRKIYRTEHGTTGHLDIGDAATDKTTGKYVHGIGGFVDANYTLPDANKPTTDTVIDYVGKGHFYGSETGKDIEEAFSTVSGDFTYNVDMGKKKASGKVEFAKPVDIMNYSYANVDEKGKMSMKYNVLFGGVKTIDLKNDEHMAAAKSSDLGKADILDDKGKSLIPEGTKVGTDLKLLNDELNDIVGYIYTGESPNTDTFGLLIGSKKKK